MTDERKENLILAMNHEHFHNDKKCKILDITFEGNQVIVDYSEDGETINHSRSFGSIE